VAQVFSLMATLHVYDYTDLDLCCRWSRNGDYRADFILGDAEDAQQVDSPVIAFIRGPVCDLDAFWHLLFQRDSVGHLFRHCGSHFPPDYCLDTQIAKR